MAHTEVVIDHNGNPGTYSWVDGHVKATNRFIHAYKNTRAFIARAHDRLVDAELYEEALDSAYDYPSDELRRVALRIAHRNPRLCHILCKDYELYQLANEIKARFKLA